jgi:hypothetical protein|tara:strand:- start:2316 stop:2588 length:273 start_codon:yes stop_codon:yes gene_type:complete
MNYLEYDFCEFQFGIYYKYLKGIKGDYYQPDDDDNIEIDKIVINKYKFDNEEMSHPFETDVNIYNILSDSIINDIMLVINEDVIKNQYYL